MTEMTKGSCNFETVSYQVNSDLDVFFLCHCRYCQKDTGSVDSEINFKPTAHLFCFSKGNWERCLDSIPQFDKFPE